MKFTERLIENERAPFDLKDSTLLFVAPKHGTDIENWRLFRNLQDALAEDGFKLVKLPTSGKGITPEFLKYNFPGYDWGPMMTELKFGYQYLLNLAEPAGWYDPVILRFRDGMVFSVEFEPDFIEFCREWRAPTDRASSVSNVCHSIAYPPIDYICKNSVYGEQMLGEMMPQLDPVLNEEIRNNERRCDEIVMVNRRVLDGLGLDADTLAELLNVRRETSSITISRTGVIFLNEYNKVIKMDSLSKAVYLLFLKHPEGIRLKDLYDYYRELLDLYRSVSRRGDNEVMEKTIRRLVEGYNNSVNVLISRIKKAFVSAFESSIAKNYYISRVDGEINRIPLDRSKVKWETVRL